MKTYPIEGLLSIINKDSYTENHFMEIEVYEVYQELETDYDAALKKVETKLLIINRELSGIKYTGRKDRIHQIQKRIKTFKSIVNKLAKKGLDFSKENIIHSIHDLAGLRVICSYTDDIYHIIDSLQRHPDIQIIQIKDYFKHPKPSGYRSVHVLIEIPVYFLEETKNLLVEIQFRTIAMDFWASLEHGLKYKNTAINSDLSNQLKQVAEEITRLEEEMLTIRKKIED